MDLANNVDGILDKAADINAASFVRCFNQKGYNTWLILEIGDEAVEYSLPRGLLQKNTLNYVAPIY